MTGKIPVYDDEECGCVIGHVSPNTKLDTWDGNNYTSGSTGCHIGYTRLKKSGKFVLIHTTQWQGGEDYGEVISPEDLVRLAIEKHSLVEVLEDYPELQAICDEIIDTD